MPNYIVVFNKDLAITTSDYIDSIAEKVEKQGGNVTQRYTSKIMKGFAGTFSEEMKKELEGMEAVKYVEVDGGASI